MKIWKISHGLLFFNDISNALLKSNNLVSMHPETAAKGTSSVGQGKAFLEAEKFDLFYLCHSNERVDVIGMFIDNRPLYSIVKGHEDWIDRQYVLIKQATNLTAYDKEFDKWWSPRNNSTFSEINPQQINLFEDKIIQPSFNCTLNDILKIRRQEISKLQINFSGLQFWKKEFVLLFNPNKDYLFERLNSISQIELRKLAYQFSLRQNIERQPVVHLRKSILDVLIKGENVNYQIIENLKQEIGAKHEKNVFQAWSDPSRVVYPFFFEPLKKEIEAYLKRGTTLIRRRLGIENYTKSTEFHFDGAQNQGDYRIWFAIYNSSHKTQKTAYQLFFEVFETTVNYGLVYMNDHTKDRIAIDDNLKFSNLIDAYRKFIPMIQTDDYKIKEPYIKMKELLEIKPQIILQGPPGTGKTYTAKNIAYNLIFDEIFTTDPTLRKEQLKTLEDSDQFKLIQFHPSYTYEDFVRGIVTETDGEKVSYSTKNKTIAEFAAVANLNFIEYSQNIKETDKEAWITERFQAYLAEFGDKLKDSKHYFPGTKVFISKKTLESITIYADFYSQGTGFEYSIEKILGYIIEEYRRKKRGGMYFSTQDRYDGMLLALIKPLYSDFEKFVGDFPKNREENIELKNYVLIIDEINRANLPSVLGELIYALEYRGEPVESMYKLENEGKNIIIPKNFYIIGTMNTADRSVGHIDYAIRRRFAFVDVLPNPEPVNEFAKGSFKAVSELFVKNYGAIDWNNPKPERSVYLAPDFRPEDVWIGHSYFIAETAEKFELKLKYEVVPILKEYVKDGILLETARETIDKLAL